MENPTVPDRDIERQKVERVRRVGVGQTKLGGVQVPKETSGRPVRSSPWSTWSWTVMRAQLSMSLARVGARAASARMC
jgi:hypothetical protein